MNKRELEAGIFGPLHSKRDTPIQPIISPYALEDPMYEYMKEKAARDKKERIDQLKALLDSSSDSSSDAPKSKKSKKKKRKKKAKKEKHGKLEKATKQRHSESEEPSPKKLKSEKHSTKKTDKDNERYTDKDKEHKDDFKSRSRSCHVGDKEVQRERLEKRRKSLSPRQKHSDRDRSSKDDRHRDISHKGTSHSNFYTNRSRCHRR